MLLQNLSYIQGLLQHATNVGNVEGNKTKKIDDKLHKDGEKRKSLTCRSCEEHLRRDYSSKHQRKKSSCKFMTLGTTTTNTKRDEETFPQVFQNTAKPP